MLWGGSRSTKACAFPCKVAAADDERYLLCAAVAAAVVLVPPLCFATSGCSCVRSSMRFLNPWLQIAVDGCMTVAWAILWGGSRSTKACVFPCKLAAAGDERYLLCAAVAAAVVLVPPLCLATSGCSCVRSFLRFLNLWLQIAVEWLHECCMGYVVGRKPEHESLRFSV